MIDSRDQPQPNPYASPDQVPLPGYWWRFRRALGRAARYYRQQMRQDGISKGQEVGAWLGLFALLLLAAILMLAATITVVNKIV